ncbi:hypothetical protein D4R86_03065 [bacterium]|nr:MAG: hypothetical protein D4R86_03065 [bacterium]
MTKTAKPSSKSPKRGRPKKKLLKEELTEVQENTTEEIVDTPVEKVDEKVEKEVKYTFEEIKETLEGFINAYNRQYFFSLKFPEMFRISEQMGKQRAADFYPSGLKYYNTRVKRQVTVFYASTKYADYFKGNVKLKAK